jgi:hypothetical protein
MPIVILVTPNDFFSQFLPDNGQHWSTVTGQLLIFDHNEAH